MSSWRVTRDDEWWRTRCRCLPSSGTTLRLTALLGAGHGAPLAKIESIAMLPLKDLSGDAEQEYAVDGMTDALIAELGKISINFPL